MRKPVVFPVLPKKNVQSEFLKNDLKITGFSFSYNITQLVASLNLTCATHETVKQGEIKAQTIFTSAVARPNGQPRQGGSGAYPTTPPRNFEL